MEEIRRAQFVRSVQFGNVVEVRVMADSIEIHSIQNDSNLLLLAAARGDMSIFEFLVERGVVLPFDEEMDQALADMLQRRQDWIDQLTGLSHRWHIPLTGVRTIHEYVVGFNWPVVCERINQSLKRREGVKVFTKIHSG